jgi:hypothetical protein
MSDYEQAVFLSYAWKGEAFEILYNTLICG